MARNDGNEDNGLLHCPMCPFFDDNSYTLALHVEETHFAEESPFVPVGNESRHAASVSLASCSLENEISNFHYLPCPEEECGEEVPWSELQEHLDFHLAEHLELEDGLIVASDMLDIPSSCPIRVSYYQTTAFLQVLRSDVDYLLHTSDTLCYSNAPGNFERLGASCPPTDGLHNSRRFMTNDPSSQMLMAQGPYKRLTVSNWPHPGLRLQHNLPPTSIIITLLLSW